MTNFRMRTAAQADLATVAATLVAGSRFLLFDRPPVVFLTYRVDLPHDADRLVERDRHALIVFDSSRRQHPLM